MIGGDWVGGRSLVVRLEGSGWGRCLARWAGFRLQGEWTADCGRGIERWAELTVVGRASGLWAELRDCCIEWGLGIVGGAWVGGRGFPGNGWSLWLWLWAGLWAHCCEQVFIQLSGGWGLGIVGGACDGWAGGWLCVWDFRLWVGLTVVGGAFIWLSGG